MQAWHRRRFIAAIDYVHSNNPRRRFAGELTAAEVFFHRRAYGRDLARLVRQGRYQFAPAEELEVYLDGKTRALYRPEVLDAVVERVLSQWLADLLARHWPSELYSYRPGVSSASAIRAFASFLREHTSARPDPRTRGLWVLRRDIKSYGESIPLDRRLWTPLEACLGKGPEAEVGTSLLHSFLPRRFVRPGESGGKEATHILERGTPTGSFVQPAINNFYLLPLDRALAKQEGFYARFGDDILYASASRAQAETAAGIIGECVDELGLALSTDKCQNLYFNGAGHPLGGDEWRSCTSVDFLGMSLAFGGMIRMRKDKMRRLQRQLDARLRSIARSMHASNAEQRVTHLAQVARSSLTPSHPLVLPDAQALWNLVDDRSQFRELDRWLQRRVVDLSLRNGIRGFRHLPPRKLYALGLPSFTAQRNLGRWNHEDASGEHGH